MAVFDCTLGRELTPAEEAARPPEVYTLDQLKTRKLSELHAEYQVRLFTDLAIGPYTIAIDSEARIDIAEAAAVALAAVQDGTSGSFSHDIEMADGTTQTITAAQLKTVVTAVRAHTNGCKTNFRSLRDQINAASSKSALAAIDITAGWP